MHGKYNVKRQQVFVQREKALVKHSHIVFLFEIKSSHWNRAKVRALLRFHDIS
jgi:hypothetical protein